MQLSQRTLLVAFAVLISTGLLVACGDATAIDGGYADDGADAAAPSTTGDGADGPPNTDPAATTGGDETTSADTVDVGNGDSTTDGSSGTDTNPTAPEPLFDPDVASIVVVAANGADRAVRVLDPATGRLKATVGATSAPNPVAWTLLRERGYADELLGGVSITTGDVNGDGKVELIVGSAPGEAPTVSVFASSGTPATVFSVGDPAATGGVRVATGDITGDGKADIVASSGSGDETILTVLDVDTFSSEPVRSEITDFDFDDLVVSVNLSSGDFNGDDRDDILVANGGGGTPQVQIIDGSTRVTIGQFFAFDPDFTGGVRVATGDINGDGNDDIFVAGGPGGAPVVRIFDGATQNETRFVTVPGSGYTGGLFLAVEDVTGDGVVDLLTAQGASPGLITIFESAGPLPLTTFQSGFADGAVISIAAAEPGEDPGTDTGTDTTGGDTGGVDACERRLVVGDQAGAIVKRFDPGAQAVREQFFAFSESFTGGTRVALGDLNGDGRAETIVAAGPAGGPHVKVFDPQTGEVTRSFFAFSASFRGGVTVAAGDINGDAFDDIVVGAGTTGTGHVKAFNGRTGDELVSFFAFGAGYTGTTHVAAGDINGDGFDDFIVAPGPGAGPQVKVFDGRNTDNVLASFFAYESRFTGGVTVAAADVNGDGFDDIVTGAASQSSHVKVFNGRDQTELASLFAYDPRYTGGVNIAAADINGDGRADIGVSPRGPNGIVKLFDGRTSEPLNTFDSGLASGAFVAMASDCPADTDTGTGTDSTDSATDTGGTPDTTDTTDTGTGTDGTDTDTGTGTGTDTGTTPDNSFNCDPSTAKLTDVGGFLRGNVRLAYNFLFGTTGCTVQSGSGSALPDREIAVFYYFPPYTTGTTKALAYNATGVLGSGVITFVSATAGTIALDGTSISDIPFGTGFDVTMRDSSINATYSYRVTLTSTEITVEAVTVTPD